MISDKNELQWIAILPDISIDRPSEKFKLGPSPELIHGCALTEKNIMNSRFVLRSSFFVLRSSFFVLRSSFC